MRGVSLRNLSGADEDLSGRHRAFNGRGRVRAARLSGEPRYRGMRVGRALNGRGPEPGRTAFRRTAASKEASHWAFNGRGRGSGRTAFRQPRHRGMRVGREGTPDDIRAPRRDDCRRVPHIRTLDDSARRRRRRLSSCVPRRTDTDDRRVGDCRLSGARAHLGDNRRRWCGDCRPEGSGDEHLPLTRAVAARDRPRSHGPARAGQPRPRPAGPGTSAAAGRPGSPARGRGRCAGRGAAG